jgi:hypothetical protein
LTLDPGKKNSDPGKTSRLRNTGENQPQKSVSNAATFPWISCPLGVASSSLLCCKQKINQKQAAAHNFFYQNLHILFDI